MSGTPRDLDLNEWLTGIGFHPADTEAKQLGHEMARTLIAQIGASLHEILPPGRDKSLVFTALEDALMRANRALAIGGGPLRQDDAAAASMKRAIVSAPVKLPEDDRIQDYKAEQIERGQRIDPLNLLPEERALQRYQDAKESGLSEYEAREEGWPATDTAPADLGEPADPEGETSDRRAPEFEVTVTSDPRESYRLRAYAEGKPDVPRVGITVEVLDLEVAAEAIEEARQAKENFLGFHVLFYDIDTLNYALSGIAKAGAVAFAGDQDVDITV